MLRPLVATAAVTAAAVLLAGCGGDDKKSDSNSGGGDNPSSASTPSAPPVASFDPPKAFVPVSAFGIERTAKDNQYTLSAGMVGQTSLISGLYGITGRNIAAQGTPWTVASAAAETTTTSDLTTPMPVQLDGKDVVAIAYVQDDKGNGTQKAKGQVVFQWIDAADGKKVAEVTADLTPLLGPGEGGDDVVSQAYDAATGQIAVGVSAGSEAAAKKAGTFTVYADPKTQKSSVIPFVVPGGVAGGIIAAVKGSNEEGASDGTIVIADGATGKITKQTPVGQEYLSVAGAGAKHALFGGSKYVKTSSAFNDTYTSTLFSVDIASGAVEQIKSQSPVSERTTFSCVGDNATAIACTGSQNQQSTEILGVNDGTGKKSWGYTSQSGSRIVPQMTTAFHGVVYAETDVQPVLLDAATGNDIPSAAPSGGATPSAGATPSEGSTPSESATPDGGSPSQGNDPTSANGSDFSLFNGKPKSPTMVSKYGGAYLQDTGEASYQTVLIALKPSA